MTAGGSDALALGPAAPTAAERLDAWERRSRPAIVAAAIVPLVGVTTGSQYGALGNVVSIVCWAVFVVDLVVHLRLRRGYLRTGFGIFDLAVVVLTSPWFLLPGVSAGQFVILLRFARVARVLMIGIKAPAVQRTITRLGRPFLYVGIVMLVCAGIVERAEDHKHGFETYGDSVWWAVVTITTVGYGDIVPETELGRITAAVLMLSGVALLGTVAASLASLFRLEDVAEASDQGPDPSPGAAPDRSPSRAGQVAPGGTSPGTGEILAELHALRSEVAALRAQLTAPGSDP